MKIPFLTLGAILFFGIFGNAAFSQTMFGIDDQGRLLNINFLTASGTLIGPTNFTTRSIAFSPDGHLFGVDGAGQLLSINPATASATVIGATPFNTHAIAFAPDGQLFGVDSNSRLLMIDPATAHGTIIGGPMLGGTHAIAFTPDGHLFGIASGGWLFSIDPATASTKFIGMTTTVIFQIAFAPDGSLFGVDFGNGRLSSIDLATATSTLIGQTPFSTQAIVFAPANRGRLSASAILDFGHQRVDTGAGQAIAVTNVGTAAVSISGVYLSDATNFGATSDCSTVAVGSSCAINVTFAPTAPCTYNAKITVVSDGAGSPLHVSLTGVGLGGGGSCTSLAPVIEFYNASLDHYFISIDAQEISDLDNGVHPGWMRTGLGFSADVSAVSGTDPVCRFYIPPQHGGSHFFSAAASECAAVLQKTMTDPNYSGYIYEAPNVFYIALPDATTGACPTGTVRVYRLWNNRADSNHRYTTSLTVVTQMVAKGYVQEGYGPSAVIMCAAG